MRFSKQKFDKQANFYHNLTNYTKKNKIINYNSLKIHHNKQPNIFYTLLFIKTCLIF